MEFEDYLKESLRNNAESVNSQADYKKLLDRRPRKMSRSAKFVIPLLVAVLSLAVGFFGGTQNSKVVSSASSQSTVKSSPLNDGMSASTTNVTSPSAFGPGFIGRNLQGGAAEPCVMQGNDQYVGTVLSDNNSTIRIYKVASGYCGSSPLDATPSVSIEISDPKAVAIETTSENLSLSPTQLSIGSYGIWGAAEGDSSLWIEINAGTNIKKVRVDLSSNVSFTESTTSGIAAFSFGSTSNISAISFMAYGINLSGSVVSSISSASCINGSCGPPTTTSVPCATEPPCVTSNPRCMIAMPICSPTSVCPYQGQSVTTGTFASCPVVTICPYQNATSNIATCSASSGTGQASPLTTSTKP